MRLEEEKHLSLSRRTGIRGWKMSFPHTNYKSQGISIPADYGSAINDNRARETRASLTLEAYRKQ